MKFFTFVQSQNKSAALITHPTNETTYRPKIPIRPELFLTSNGPKVAPVDIQVEPKFEDAVAALQSKLDKDFVFAHTAIDREKELDDNLKQLDKDIADVYNKIAPNGMMIVIFGGKTYPSVENGACLVRVKKPRKEEL